MPVDESAPVAPAVKPPPAGTDPLPAVHRNGVMPKPASPPAAQQTPPSLQTRFAWYSGAMLVTSVVLFFGMGLHSLSLKAPFMYGSGSGSSDSAHGTSNLAPDVLLILPLVKTTLERGSHWRNERMGYPGIQELHDFPIIDHVHFALIWFMGQIDLNAMMALLILILAHPLAWGLGFVMRRVRSIPPRTITIAASVLSLAAYFILHAAMPGSRWHLDAVEVFNLYYLSTYPLTTLTGMYALRRLGLSFPMAATGGLLYAFLPYHYMRGEMHYFLSAYWVIPLTWLPALDACRGELPFFQRDEDGRYRLALRRWSTLTNIVLMAATASAGAYYAFYACAIYAFVAVYVSYMLWTWRAAAAMFSLVALIAIFGIANHFPTFAYTAENGRNTITERMPGEAEIYGMKFAHLVLPVDQHNLFEFGRIKARYNSDERPLQNENTCATLGIIGSVGFIGLLISLLSNRARGWPYGPLSALTWFMFLYGTMGGIGALFNLLILDQIRCPNRISIYLAFICLFAALRPIDIFLATRTGWARRLRYPAIAGLAFLGVADQTPTPWFTEHIVHIYQNDANRFWEDKRFFTHIEETMPEGAKIFCMPYIPYPEEAMLHEMNTYEHARGYLFTNKLIWSYGAIKHREVDAWQENVFHGDHKLILVRLAARGFDGIFIDKRGFVWKDGDTGEAMISELKAIAESNGRVKLPPILRHEDGRQAFMDIRPYRDWLKAEDPVQFAKWVAEERDWVAMTWINGFLSIEPYGHRNNFRWAYKDSTIAIVNPSDRVRKFRFWAAFGVNGEGDYRVSLDCPTITNAVRPGGPAPWHDEITIEWDTIKGNPPKRVFKSNREYILEIPPGRHFVKLHCTLPKDFMPGDYRPLCYFMHRIQFEEVK